MRAPMHFDLRISNGIQLLEDPLEQLAAAWRNARVDHLATVVRLRVHPNFRDMVHTGSYSWPYVSAEHVGTPELAPLCCDVAATTLQLLLLESWSRHWLQLQSSLVCLYTQLPSSLPEISAHRS